MKKVVFTIQMIALMAMFPVYLVVELNHETGKVMVTDSASGVKKIPEETKVEPLPVSKD